MKYSAFLLLVGAIWYAVLLVIGIVLFNGSTDYSLVYCDGINGNKWWCNLTKHINSVVGDYWIIHIAWLIYTGVIVSYLFTPYNPSNVRWKKVFDQLFWIFSGGYFWFLLSCYIVDESYDSQSYFNVGILISIILIPFFILGIKKWISKGSLSENSLIFICIFQIICLVSLLLPHMYQFAKQEGRDYFIASVKEQYFLWLIQSKNIEDVKDSIMTLDSKINQNFFYKYSNIRDIDNYVNNITRTTVIDYNSGANRGDTHTISNDNGVVMQTDKERESQISYEIFLKRPWEHLYMSDLTDMEQKQMAVMFWNEKKVWEIINQCSKKWTIILTTGASNTQYEDYITDWDYRWYWAFFLDDQKIFESYWYKNVLYNNYFENPYISWWNSWKICGTPVNKEELLGFWIPFNAQLKKPWFGDFRDYTWGHTYLLEKDPKNWKDDKTIWLFPYRLAEFMSQWDRSTTYGIEQNFR